MLKLIEQLGLGGSEKSGLEKLAKHPDVAHFPVKFTKYQTELLKKVPELGKIFLPDENEIGAVGETSNNYGEAENRVAGLKGAQHKYQPTLLLTVTDDCVADCRYCYRRETAKQDYEIVDTKQFSFIFDYVKKHPEINNVLISGGDPLVMKRKNLEELLEGFSKIDSVQFIRIGSKVLVDNPGMVTPELAEMLGKYSKNNKRLYIVNHFNHPAEITNKTYDSASRLQEKGIMLMNQHPILAGVNDNEEVIAELYNKLAAVGIRPYYAFHLMPVKGATHLQTPIDETFYMLERAKERLSGPAKTFRYILPTRSGKIEVLGFDNQENPTQIYLKYHEAKGPQPHGVFTMPYQKGTKWLEV